MRTSVLTFSMLPIALNFSAVRLRPSTFTLFHKPLPLTLPVLKAISPALVLPLLALVALLNPLRNTALSWV